VLPACNQGYVTAYPGLGGHPSPGDIGPERSDYSTPASGGEFVLVDQASEPVASTDVAAVRARRLSKHRVQPRKGDCRCRDLLGYPLVRAKGVVVLRIAPEDALQVTDIDDEEMIEALRPDRSYEPFCIGVRVRCPERSLEDLGTFRSKDFIEARHVFRVAITYEEPCIDSSISEITHDVSRLLGDPSRVG